MQKVTLTLFSFSLNFRFFQKIQNLPVYQVKDTVNLNNVRLHLEKTAKPLTERAFYVMDKTIIKERKLNEV